MTHPRQRQKILDNKAISAAKTGRLTRLEFLAAQGADIHAQHEEALIMAVSENHEHIVDWLLKKGADPHIDQDEALYEACVKGHTNMVQKFLDLGADASSVKNRCLRAVAGEGHFDIAKILINHGANPAEPGQDPVYVAIKFDNVDILQLFNETGTVNFTQHNELSLHTASEYNSIKCLTYILEHTTPSQGVLDVTLWRAAKAGMPDTCQYLLDNYKGFPQRALDNALFGTLESQNESMALMMLDNGADPKDANVLMRAAGLGWLATVKKCFGKSDTSPEAIDHALIGAIENSRMPVVDFFLEQGYDINFSNGLAIWGACCSNSRKTIDDIIARGGKGDWLDPELLDFVIQEDAHNSLDFLFEQGVKPDDAQNIFARQEKITQHLCREVHAKWHYAKYKEADLPKDYMKGKTMDDLRRQIPGVKTTGLVQMAQAGRIQDVVLHCLKNKNSEITLDDLKLTDDIGNNLIRILGTRGELKHLANPDLWQNSQELFNNFCKQVPPAFQEQLQSESVIARMHRRHLRKNRPLKPTSPKRGV